jgi:hypothetical protein
MSAKGSIYVELVVSGRWALSLLTEGWTPEEVAALYRDDEGAREALTEEAVRRVLKYPDIDSTVYQISIDRRPDAWRCDSCEYVHPESETPEACPACDVGPFGSWTGAEMPPLSPKEPS